MRYLFFDTECCDGKHICEFGYVICDENFCVLEKDGFAINPQKEFNLGPPNGERRIKLYYTDEQYFASPDFSFYYERIKTLLLQKDQIIIGHSLKNDVKFLRVACKRYDLPTIEFKYFDSQQIYKNIYCDKDDISLEHAIHNLNIEVDCHLHKSDDDAYLTMKLVDTLCKQNKMPLQKLLKTFSMPIKNYRDTTQKVTLGDAFGDILKKINK